MNLLLDVRKRCRRERADEEGFLNLFGIARGKAAGDDTAEIRRDILFIEAAFHG